MTTPDTDPFEFVAAGELLVDLVADDRDVPLAEVRSFTKFCGGAPANVAANMQRLGVRSTIVSRVGRDGLGTFLIDELVARHLDTRYISRDPSAPTSMVVVTAGKTPPEFVAYRHADTRLAPDDIPETLIRDCRIFHTTAHGIARTPTRDTILAAFRLAHERGTWTSFDPNYAESFWPDRDEARSVIREFLACATFCKPSLDDCERLFGSQPVERHLETLHAWGAERVILTLGKHGAVFSHRGEAPRRFDAIAPPKFVDPTGAGDAFTAGMFAAYLRTGEVERSMHAGIRAATFKIQQLGPIAALPSLDDLLA